MKQENADTSNAPEIEESVVKEEDQASETAIYGEGQSSHTISHPEVGFFKSTVSKVLGDIHSSDDPQLYSPTRKNTIVLLIALIGINGSMAQLIYLPGIFQMANDLDASIPAIDSTVSAYVVFAGIAVSFLIYWYIVPAANILLSSLCSGQVWAMLMEESQCISAVCL